MSWTEITRPQYRRDHLRYASDLTDAEWSLLAPLLPAPHRMGRPRTVDLRAVMNAILYILATGYQWRALPKDFPPRSTVQHPQTTTRYHEWPGSTRPTLPARAENSRRPAAGRPLATARSIRSGPT
jgi:putative transposase